MESNIDNIVIELNNNNIIDSQSNAGKHNVHKEAINGLDPRCDVLHCGKCGANFGSIHKFIFHKLTEESNHIYYEDFYINGKLVKVPKLSEKDIEMDLNINYENNSEYDINRDQYNANNNSINNKSKEETKTQLTTDQEIKQEVIQEVDNEESNTNPIITIIIEGQNSKKFYNCNDCNKIFNQKSRAIRHLESEHNRDLNTLKLIKNKPIITINDNNNSNNTSDISIIPNNISLKTTDKLIPRFNCDKCGANVKSKRALTVHQLTHSEVRSFCCPYSGCSFRFKTKGSMERHCRRHTNERPYKCHLCNRSFRESGALTRHLKSRYVCVNKSDSDLPNYGKSRALPNFSSTPNKK